MAGESAQSWYSWFRGVYWMIDTGKVGVLGFGHVIDWSFQTTDDRLELTFHWVESVVGEMMEKTDELQNSTLFCNRGNSVKDPSNEPQNVLCFGEPGLFLSSSTKLWTEIKYRKPPKKTYFYKMLFFFSSLLLFSLGTSSRRNIIGCGIFCHVWRSSVYEWGEVGGGGAFFHWDSLLCEPQWWFRNSSKAMHIGAFKPTDRNATPQRAAQQHWSLLLILAVSWITC